MFRKIKNINLSYDKQALVYYTCVNYGVCCEEVKRKIDYLCRKDELLGKELFKLVTTGASAKAIAIKYHLDDRAVYRARKNFYESWYTVKEAWQMPRKAKRDFGKRTEEIMEKTLDRLEACIDDYDTPIPLNQLTSALGTLYEKGCHARKGDDEKEGGNIKVDIRVVE